ncbi:AAA family ATPase [Sporolactobacillus nakayamae]|uniref:Nuclease SbcCD subunit C n=1 Tax=Sporolactobacillus nakayamae TaxID=269670 RepID=A0A1I2TTC3_9BACL|nr:SMC family ATPase [Sporolactobacillus nakayamae]SFG68185.1 exonuclease SbcC [Sporolactobacillus nakayamae]
MKPIELTIRGLNSFREEQCIDFETLCADGLFGIFGPTGSGKSTILDGITLALYGTVERAANNTTGILNQLEEQMSVGFTFELTGDRTDRYRAERSYKKTKDGALRLSSCRLLKLGAINEVLADKERDLTRSVQEILGLTHDDFTRAVVLPQGKFAEFLTLKGNERRKMLQRLFHLEKYGDELTSRLKHASDERKQYLQIISEKQAMLGDASEEAVSKAKQRCTQIESELRELQTSLEKADAEKKLFEQLRHLIEEKESKSEVFEKLSQEKNKYEEIRVKLDMSEAAEKLMPFLEALQEAEQENADAKSSHAEICRRFDRIKAKLDSAKEESEQAKKSLNDQEPKLNAEKQQLLQGASIQDQLQNEQNALQRLQKARDELEQKLNKARIAAEQDQNDVGKMKNEAEAKERKLSLLEVPSDRRLFVQQALQDKKEIDSLDHYLEEKRHEWIQFRDALNKCKKELKQLDDEQARADKRDASLFIQNQEVYNRAVDTSRLIRSAHAFVELTNKKIEQEREKINRRNLSLQLVAALREGEPCPVCGALHHPNPAATGGEVISETALNNKRTTLQKASEFLNNQQQEIRICIAQLEYQVKAFANRAQAVQVQVGQNTDLSADFSEWEKSGVKQILDQIALRVREEKQDQLRVADQWTRQEEQTRQSDSARATLQAQEKVYEEKMVSLKTQAVAKKSERDERMEEWKSRYMSFEQIQKEDQSIRESDRQADQLRREVKRIKDQLKTFELNLAHTQDILRELEGRWSESAGRHEALMKTAEQLISQLRELAFTEDMPLKKMALETEEKVNQLKQRCELSDQSMRTALENYHLIDKECANASARLERSERTHQSSRAKWTGRLSDSRFDQREAVLNAYLPIEKHTAFSNDLANYAAQTTRLSSEIQSLSEKIDGKFVSKAQLDEAEKNLIDLNETVQKLIQTFGGAVKERENVEKNHKLFLTLEAERKKNQKTADQFEQLQRVFRGNAFVEFVAEEQLQQVCTAASKRLGELTHNRYVLEVDEQGGFIIRDNGNGGIYRPVSSLSGGETFLTSLALALSLSEQIQLRGNVPLQFFFLDEGFGSLDPELLDTVVTALEKLHMRRLAIGVISHVPEMRERLPRRLIVSPAVPSGRGSSVHMEMI